MPFTPSHAVVALPFVRTPLVPAAIAVGAMTPDLPLFVRGLPLHYGRTHAFEWLPLTVVLALALLLVWRCVLRPAARELAPAWLARRLPEEWDHGAAPALWETFALSRVRPDRDRAVTSSGRVSWGRLALLVLSLLLGVLSHIVWDLFTHEGRWGVTAIPALEADWGALAGYKWLQHGSSAVGLAIIGVYLLLWLRHRSAASIRRILPGGLRWAWWLSLPAALVIAWLLGLAAFSPLDADFTVAHLAYRVLPPACAVWGAVTVALCVVVQLVRRRS
ncbi:DUF4184 family protein [Microbacterium yannicii]|uniref:DUF4184 family protein n=1 Tax=Microbacterium yannicii TaxID=671622 RepID=UPI00036930DD|nr:DUF4184 family protein [Microbacterium yannicii]